MKIKVISGVLIFSLALNLAVIGTFLYKRFLDPEPGFFPGDRMNRGQFFREMAIGEAEREKIISLFMDFRKENSATQKQISELEDQLFKKLQGGNTDLDGAYKIMDKIGEKRLALGKKALNQFLKAKTFLTPEQQDHFYNMIMKRKPGHQFRRPPQEMFRERKKHLEEMD